MAISQYQNVATKEITGMLFVTTSVVVCNTINANTHIKSCFASCSLSRHCPASHSGPPPRYDTASLERLGGEGRLALNLAGETN